jgi:hypothetical protein
MSAVAPTASAPSPPRQSGSSLTVAAQMFAADFLKLCSFGRAHRTR